MSREGYRTPKVVEVPKDSTATVIEYTVKTNGAADDISTATAILFNSKTIDGTAVDTDVACSFTGTGSDGKIDVPVSAATVGTVRDLIADLQYTIGGKVAVTYVFVIRILARGKV